MRTSLTRLAESISKGPLKLTKEKEAAATLYPPLPRLLRSHRNLQPDLRPLGDDYVKAEFRRHKDVTNPVHIMGFLSQWKMYLDEMPPGPNSGFKGKKLDRVAFDKMSNEQLGQLYELMHAAQGVWKPVGEDIGGKEPQKPTP